MTGVALRQVAQIRRTRRWLTISFSRDASVAASTWCQRIAAGVCDARRAWIAATTRQDPAVSRASFAIPGPWISGRNTTSLPGAPARAAPHFAESAGNSTSSCRIPGTLTSWGESIDRARRRSVARCAIRE